MQPLLSRVLESAERHFRADDRCLGLYLFGSSGRGTDDVAQRRGKPVQSKFLIPDLVPLVCPADALVRFGFCVQARGTPPEPYEPCRPRVS
jgi:hypothetical protein